MITKYVSLLTSIEVMYPVHVSTFVLTRYTMYSKIHSFSKFIYLEIVNVPFATFDAYKNNGYIYNHEISQYIGIMFKLDLSHCHIHYM